MTGMKPGLLDNLVIKTDQIKIWMATNIPDWSNSATVLQLKENPTCKLYMC